MQKLYVLFDVYFWHALGIVHWNLYKNPSSMNKLYKVFGCHGNTCYVIFIGAIFLYDI